MCSIWGIHAFVWQDAGSLPVYLSKSFIRQGEAAQGTPLEKVVRRTRFPEGIEGNVFRKPRFSHQKLRLSVPSNGKD